MADMSSPLGLCAEVMSHNVRNQVFLYAGLSGLPTWRKTCLENFIYSALQRILDECRLLGCDAV
jgi:hypothetical protein